MLNDLLTVSRMLMSLVMMMVMTMMMVMVTTCWVWGSSPKKNWLVLTAWH